MVYAATQKRKAPAVACLPAYCCCTVSEASVLLTSKAPECRQTQRQSVQIRHTHVFCLATTPGMLLTNSCMQLQDANQEHKTPRLDKLSQIGTAARVLQLSRLVQVSYLPCIKQHLHVGGLLCA